MRKNSGNIIIISLVVLLLIATSVAGYFWFQYQQPNVNPGGPIILTPSVTPTPTNVEETANPDSIGTNWKTYTNSTLHFSLKYPPNWNFEEVPSSTHTAGNGLWLSSSTFPPMGTDALPDIAFFFSYEDKSANWQPQYFDNYKSEIYQLGNIPATKITGTNKEAQIKEFVILAKTANYYIEIHTNQSGQAMKYFDQILSTFRSD